jgi:dicarboxylate/amino acid:cation (Na+ or H+) symporter, DAACS family
MQILKKNYVQLLMALVLGAVLGTICHHYIQAEWVSAINSNFLQPLAQIFLRLIFMVVVPMLFSALVIGVHDLGDSHGLGKVVSRTLLYTIVASSASVLIGIGLVNTFKPGSGMQIDQSVLADQALSVGKIQKNAQEAKSVVQTIVELVPKNPIDAATKAMDGEMLSLMVFALFFGIALSLTTRFSTEKEDHVIKFLEEVFAACMKIVEMVMRLAPIAVFALMFNTAFKLGHGVFGTIFNYVAIVFVGLLLQQFIIYASLLKLVARRSPWEFFTACKEVYLYAFSTASSNATLPKSLELAETKLNLSPKISRFVLTVGSTANQNGTALFEGVTVLFLAQVYNIDLTIAQQVQVVLMSILAGIGTAGVPGGSLPLIMILLQSVGIPPEGIGLILGVDRFLDMCRTTINVSGDLVIAAMVSRDEKADRSPAL